MTKASSAPLASLAALAAALTLTATPSLAQDGAAPPPESQIVIPEAPAASQPDIAVAPPPAPSSEPVYAPPSPVVQATSGTPEQASPSAPASPSARPQPRAAAPQAAPARAAPAPAAPRTAPEPTPSRAVSTTPSPLVDMRPQAEASPVVTQRTGAPQSLSDTSTAYVMAGGAFLLLIGAGALGYAVSRSRRTDEPTKASRPVATAHRRPVTAAAPEPAAIESVATPAPSLRAATAARSEWPELEDMVAAKPDAANPFLTRRARLRRAKFLLEHGEVEPLKAEARPAPEPVAERRPAPRSTRPRASHGVTGTHRPRQNWKPATT